MQDNVAVLDALYERRPPFSLDDVVAEIADLLRSYGVPTVTGDGFGADLIVEAFAKNGIAFEQSSRTKSEIYLESLPLFTSARVRLLDHPRLTHQITSLERRTGRTGKDSVSHPDYRNAHDDMANAACGALVLAATEATSSLVRTRDLLAPGGAPSDVPARFSQVFVSTALDGDGRVASTFWGVQNYDRARAQLWLLDFETGNFRSEIIRQIVGRLREHELECRAFGPLSLAITEPQLVAYFGRCGLDSVPFISADLQALALGVAVPISERRVQICREALEKSRIHPFGAAIQLRFNRADDVLSKSLLHGLAVGLRLEEQILDPRRDVSAQDSLQILDF